MRLQSQWRHVVLRRHDLQSRDAGCHPNRGRMTAIDNPCFSRPEFSKYYGDEVLGFHVPRQPGIHLLSKLGQIDLGEGQIAEDGEDRGAPAYRVKPFALDVTDDETRTKLSHRDVVKIAADNCSGGRRLIVRGKGYSAKLRGQRPQNRTLDFLAD